MERMLQASSYPRRLSGQRQSGQPANGSQKSCGQPLGEGWPRANRSGTGRGGDV